MARRNRIRVFIAAVILSVPSHLDAAQIFASELEPDVAWQLIDDLRSDKPLVHERAERMLISAKDPSIAAALVELIFFRKEARDAADRILQALFDKQVPVQRGNTYKGWFEYVGSRSDIEPKVGYLRFKAKEYSRIDPAFASFLDERHPRTIRPEEIIWGGVTKDGIPALTRPAVLDAERADYLGDDEIVFGIEVAGKTRTYPKRILASHEMVNDEIGGRSVSIAYCTLCGAAIAYETDREGDEPWTFGSSGLLYRSNKLMYDHQTNTLWSQISGEPVMGPLVGKGMRLSTLPTTVSTWGDWRLRHPETTVLSLDTGYDRDYSGRAYAEYFSSPDLMFPVWKRDTRLEPKDVVFVVRLDGIVVAYPLEVLMRREIVTDEVDGVHLLLLADPVARSVRVYRTMGETFRVKGSQQLIGDGKIFDVSESSLTSDENRFPRVSGHEAYWFGVHAQYPNVELRTPTDDQP